MKHYLDITLLAYDEVPIYFVRNKVYSKLHKALFELQSTEIAISFPKYKVLLGDVIRLHGTESKLSELQNTSWLGGLSGYCQVSPIQTVPDDVSYRVISRIQANMTEAKLRRLIKRDSISESEIKQYKAKMFGMGLDNPYLELQSNSNGHKHRRYLQFGELKKESVEGIFDAFGLSKTATIPWF